MLLEACLNGNRKPGAHPSLPISPEDLAGDARRAVPEEAYRGLEPLSAEAAERRFAKVLADPRQRVLVAEEEGAGVAGTLTLVVVPNLAHGGSPYAIVENVVVDEARRGSGVGSALVREAVSRAKAAGAYKLSLTANLSREAAHGFYRSLGLEEPHKGFEVILND